MHPALRFRRRDPTPVIAAFFQPEQGAGFGHRDNQRGRVGLFAQGNGPAGAVSGDQHGAPSIEERVKHPAYIALGIADLAPLLRFSDHFHRQAQADILPFDGVKLAGTGADIDLVRSQRHKTRHRIATETLRRACARIRAFSHTEGAPCEEHEA